MALPLLLTFSSCGGGDDKSTNTGDSTAPIKIGLLTTLSGALSRWAPSHRAAALMALREINEAGGVLGRELELVVADTGTDPDQAVIGARELIDQDVALILGPVISSATLKVAREVTIAQGILLISPASTSAEISTLEDDDLVWRTAASDLIKAKVAAEVAFDSGARRAGVIFIDNSFGVGLSDEFATQFVLLGGEIINSVPYPELSGNEIENYDYRSHVNLVMNNEPDLVYLISFADDGEKIAIAADALVTDDYRPQLLVEIPPSIESLTQIGLYEGLLGVEQQSPTSANHRLFLSNYIAQYDAEPELLADALYDAFYLAALAIQQASSTQGPDIAAQLRDASTGGTPINVGEYARALELLNQGADIDYEGASGSIEFDSHGDVSTATYRVWKVGNGAFVDVKTVSFP
ncbi:MAG: branched-chain amino acid transport system substrate-binding protein [Candidatus Latescibacterota bacterium]|jgi:branched-chain amino acid transport system substrate-binding protein